MAKAKGDNQVIAVPLSLGILLIYAVIGAALTIKDKIWTK